MRLERRKMARMRNRMRLVILGIAGACAAGCASGSGAWKATGYSQTAGTDRQ
jgi:hypothetical protein